MTAFETWYLHTVDDSGERRLGPLPRETVEAMAADGKGVAVPYYASSNWVDVGQATPNTGEVVLVVSNGGINDGVFFARYDPDDEDEDESDGFIDVADGERLSNIGKWTRGVQPPEE